MVLVPCLHFPLLFLFLLLLLLYSPGLNHLPPFHYQREVVINTNPFQCSPADAA